jgi:hypothetical protein
VDLPYGVVCIVEAAHVDSLGGSPTRVYAVDLAQGGEVSRASKIEQFVEDGLRFTYQEVINESLKGGGV